MSQQSLDKALIDVVKTTIDIVMYMASLKGVGSYCTIWWLPGSIGEGFNLAILI